MDSTLKEYRTFMDGVYDIMIANESYETWKKETLDFTQEYISRSVFGSYSEEEIEQGKQNLLSSVPEASFAWIRYFVMFDPAPLFISISCPVLALNGEKDCQVLPAQNICAIKTGLKQAGNTKTKTMILPGLNHLFQNCDSGLLHEYGIIEETFDPGTLELISDWIWQQVK